MNSMAEKIQALHPTADPTRDFRVQDDSDGRGQFLATWDEAKLGPRPTSEDLARADAMIEAIEYSRNRRDEWQKSKWNGASQNSAMIKWFRGDRSEMEELNQFDLDVRAKWKKSGA